MYLNIYLLIYLKSISLCLSPLFLLQKKMFIYHGYRGICGVLIYMISINRKHNKSCFKNVIKII